MKRAHGGIPQGAMVVRDDAGQPQLALIGSFGFSTDGLGLTTGNPLNLIQASETAAESAMLSQWVEAQWAGLPADAEAKATVVNALKALATCRAPADVYALILHHLFRSRSEELDEDQVVKAATGIRNIVVWRKLFKFQMDEAARTPSQLIEMLGFDYFALLDLLTISRSRKHIEKYYGTSETGRFPDRLKPINIKAEVDRAGQFRSIREINLEIRRLNLAAYAPLRYVLPHKQAAYDAKYSTQIRGGEGFFRQVDREESLIHLQDRTQLTRRTIHRVLVGSGRLDDFARNPQQYIEIVADVINRCKRLAELVQTDDGERVYFVVETKSGLFADDLRQKEGAKIACGMAHFEALAVRESPARYLVANSVGALVTPE